jgi:hypothetical protein
VLARAKFDGFDISSISMAVPALIRYWAVPGPAFANTFVMSNVGIMPGALSPGPIGDRIGAQAGADREPRGARCRLLTRTQVASRCARDGAAGGGAGDPAVITDIVTI